MATTQVANCKTDFSWRYSFLWGLLLYLFFYDISECFCYCVCVWRQLCVAELSCWDVLYVICFQVSGNIWITINTKQLIKCNKADKQTAEKLLLSLQVNTAPEGNKKWAGMNTATHRRRDKKRRGDKRREEKRFIFFRSQVCLKMLPTQVNRTTKNMYVRWCQGRSDWAVSENIKTLSDHHKSAPRATSIQLPATLRWQTLRGPSWRSRLWTS